MELRNVTKRGFKKGLFYVYDSPTPHTVPSPLFSHKLNIM